MGSEPSWEALSDQELLPNFDFRGFHEILANTSKLVSLCGFALYPDNMEEGNGLVECGRDVLGTVSVCG